MVSCVLLIKINTVLDKHTHPSHHSHHGDHVHTDVTLNRQLRRAHDYCTKHTLSSLVQWLPVMTVGGLPIDEAKDLHLGSRKGKVLRQLCLHVQTPVLKGLIRKLAYVNSLRQQSPAAQACYTNWCTLHMGETQDPISPSSGAQEVVAPKEGLSGLPTALRLRLHAIVLGWWVRFNIAQKGLGYYLRNGWSNDVDPVTLDNVYTELPRVFIFTAYEFGVKKRKCWVRCRSGDQKGEWKPKYIAVGPKPTKTPRVFVFDVRTLDNTNDPIRVVIEEQWCAVIETAHVHRLRSHAQYFHAIDTVDWLL